MSDGHAHRPAHRASAPSPLSLLRLSAGQRLAGAAALLALLWAMVFATLA